MAGRTCRVKGCDRVHPWRMFCCKPHWYALPQEMRDEIWRRYRARGPFTVEYLQAAENAEAFLEDRDAKDMSEALS